MCHPSIFPSHLPLPARTPSCAKNVPLSLALVACPHPLLRQKCAAFPNPTPPQYFALIIRAIGVLEGIALVGNPEFAIVDEVRRWGLWCHWW